MKFILTQSDEMIVTHSGLAIVGQLIDKTNLKERLNNIYISKTAKNHK